MDPAWVISIIAILIVGVIAWRLWGRSRGGRDNDGE